jgi:hypothetical protein
MSAPRSRRRSHVPPPSTQRRGGWTGRRIALLLGGIVLAVGALVLGIMLIPPSPPEGVESFEVTSRQHVEGPVTYAQVPPVGGDHWAQWQNCGYYSSQIPSERAVHSMEHGAVWITYKSDINPDEATRLRQLANSQTYVLASPFRDLPSPIVASAWGRQLKLESTDDPRLERFIRAFRNSPTAPERGGACYGGVGIPN